MKVRETGYLWLMTLLAALLILTFSLNAKTGDTIPDLSKIEKKVQELIDKGEIPGLSLVIVNGDNEPFVKGFGYADLQKETAVTSETLFELASCSKAFTALAVLQLEERGLIKLDAAVSDYLPWFYVKYEDKDYNVTIQQLLHHTSGIPWETLDDIPPGNTDDALEQAVRNIVGVELDHIPGKKYEYSNINYDILGAVIEKVSGDSFEEYVKNYVLVPLGLSHTQVGVEKGNPLMAKGYKIGFFAPRQYDSPVFRGNNPAAYIISNGSDMSRWLRIQMGLVKTDFAALVQKSQQPDLTVQPSPNLTSYAKGWFINQYRKGKVFHTGLNPNFTTYIGFLPGEKIGVAVMANSNSVYPSFIGNTVLKLLAGEEASQKYPSESNVDTICSVISLVLGLYSALVIVLILLRIIGGFRGKIEFEAVTWKKVSRLIFSLFLGLPFLYGIYLIPYALADLGWKTALVWAPISFLVFALSLVSALVVSYIHFVLSLVLVTKNRYRNEIPLITIISMLAGLSGTAMLFLITTSFFSTVALKYLLFYFGLAYLLYVLGRKIVETKMINISNNIALDLRIDLIEKIFSTRYQRFEKLHDGRIFTTLNSDTAALAGSAGLVIMFITNVVTAVSTFVYMTTISLLSTIIVFSVLALMIMYYIVVSKRSRVYMEAARDTANVYMSLLNGLIHGYKELAIHKNKKFLYKEELIDSTKKNCSKSITAAMKFLNANIIGDSVVLVILGVISIAMPRFMTGADIGTLIVFVMVIIYLLGPIRNILTAIQPLTRLRVSWNRIKEFVRDLDIEDSQKSVRQFVRDIDVPKARESALVETFNPRDKVIDSIKVEGLMFAYEDEGEEKGFSIGPIDFEVNKGETLFIVGGNGSGKTTVAKLITGLYIREGGCIKINGTKVEDSQLGEYFSTIFSSYHLFKKLYDIDIDQKKPVIRKYLELLGLKEKVQLKDGEYSTLDLSGGQRKRLALFQCYLENRPIFLFDELAADQDPDFRKFFYRELLEKMREQEKIVIAITHDDHYFDAADKIVKLDMGKVDFVENRIAT
jgi:cyclic peptide transporter